MEFETTNFGKINVTEHAKLNILNEVIPSLPIKETLDVENNIFHNMTTSNHITHNFLSN